MAIFAPVAAQASAPPSQEIAASDPIELFNSVCLGDQVQLSKQAFAPLDYKAVPTGAKEALAFSLMIETAGAPAVKATALPDREVQNQFFVSLPARRAFLMMPAPPTARGPAASQCGVIWKGQHYREALKAAKTIRPTPKGGPEVPDRPAIPGLGFDVIHAEGAVIGVAEDGDWTVLRIAADTSPQDQIK